MKKAYSVICCIVLTIVLLAGCTAKNNGGGATTPNKPDVNPPVEQPKNHLVLDADGNYGGSIDKKLYGEGAPLNGALDHPDAGYYASYDYYNAKSTQTRTILPYFAPYQQRMADSDGIACAMMMMHYDGKDIVNTNTELALVQKYEELNNTTVYGNGTTVDGMVNLYKSLGYVTRTGNYSPLGSTSNEKVLDFCDWAEDYLKKGQAIMVRFQDGMHFGWHIIIGIDYMDKEYGRPNMLIMADPCDYLDHNQDGYYTLSAARFFMWWFNALPSGEKTNEFEYIVVSPNKVVNINRVEENLPDREVPELHLILNPDGSYGGSSNPSLYGTGAMANGEKNHLNSIYYNFPDYYTMQNNSSRTLIYNFRAYEQTMASSCGICSTMVAINHLGKDINVMNEEWLVKKYESINNDTIYNKGVGKTGLSNMASALGCTAEADSYSRSSYVDRNSMCFPTYGSFTQWVIGHLNGNRAIPVSCRLMGSGHWQVIFGIDTMGTESPYDDVVFLADSSDAWDHYQDGYNTIAGAIFYGQWFNGSMKYNQQHCVYTSID